MLPVVSLVISLAALLGVVVLSLGLIDLAGGMDDGDLDGAQDGPLIGQLAKTPTGQLRGADLADQVTKVMASNNWDVSDLRCPYTTSVAQNATTVCHGTIDSQAWAVVVFFEDHDGRFTLVPV